MADFVDVRQMVLGGKVEPKRQAIYVERFGGWFTLQELMGNERATVLQASINQKTGRVDMEVMYAGLVVFSLRYPRSDTMPVEPIPPAPLADGATPDEEDAYKKAVAKYQRDWSDFQHPYPTGHSKSGELVFQPTDRDTFSKMCPGNVIELIAQDAFTLSGFKPEDIEEEKKVSATTVIDSTLTSSQNS